MPACYTVGFGAAGNGIRQLCHAVPCKQYDAEH